MRLDFYTLECRVFGQAKRAQTRCECTALTKPSRADSEEKPCVFLRERSDFGVPENACRFWGFIKRANPYR